MDIYRDICGGIFGHMGYHLYDNPTQDPAAKRQDKYNELRSEGISENAA